MSATAVGGSTPAGPKAAESDANMESSFRRLLSAIEAERENIKTSWQQLQDDKAGTTMELESLRQETEQWCASEKQKIDAQWKQLDRLTEKMAALWPSKVDIIRVNCSGQVYELPRQTLCSIKGSYLAELFSEENSGTILPDSDGCYYLDINPHCFALVIEYLLNRRLRLDAPLPVIPKSQQHNMEVLAEAWQLKPFLRENRINGMHTTSLLINGDTIQATHPGWQLVSSQYPMPLAHPYYFEARIKKNPGAGSSGGLAIGVVGHIPLSSEVHSIRLPNSVMYCSGNGLIGDGIDPAEAKSVQGGLEFADDSCIGVRHDVATRSLQWFFNGEPIGSCALRAEAREQSMRELYPVFALFVPGQIVEVAFRPTDPTTAYN